MVCVDAHRPECTGEMNVCVGIELEDGTRV